MVWRGSFRSGRCGPHEVGHSNAFTNSSARGAPKRSRQLKRPSRRFRKVLDGLVDVTIWGHNDHRRSGVESTMKSVNGNDTKVQYLLPLFCQWAARTHSSAAHSSLAVYPLAEGPQEIPHSKAHSGFPIAGDAGAFGYVFQLFRELEDMRTESKAYLVGRRYRIPARVEHTVGSRARCPCAVQSARASRNRRPPAPCAPVATCMGYSRKRYIGMAQPRSFSLSGSGGQIAPAKSGNPETGKRGC
jgi:hypothetical protein